MILGRCATEAGTTTGGKLQIGKRCGVHSEKAKRMECGPKARVGKVDETVQQRRDKFAAAFDRKFAAMAAVQL